MQISPMSATAKPALGLLTILALVGGGLAPTTHAVVPPDRVAPPATPAPPAGGDGLAGSAGGASVTLLTGDTVHLTDVGEGRRAVELEPGPGRDEVEIHQTEVDGDLTVLPADALPFVAEGLLDADLFNIDALLEQGYDDASTDQLPLLTTYAEGRAGAATSALAALPAAESGAELTSIRGRAVTVDKDTAGEFWTGLTGVDAADAADYAATFAESGDDPVWQATGVQHIWLDAIVTASLDQSTGQIGAPDAWDAGIDGTGVTVAVLDSGVDAQHPDLIGRVSQQANFSDSDNLQDHLGHGTHVAATIGGSGDGSDGSRKGVAPGADLISGKVLDDDGRGALSSVIEGMEWAVDSGADVVNLSLGSDPTDGTDPLSQALNQLAADSNTLFVVAAGNDGPGTSTIGAPGSADAALTVGAVDRDESLAGFSSRGPRPGDLAVKPDVTAPGVGIVAARASGTTMGTPVDDLYTAANGTSMATPHVAGAAALLASQHPDWDGDQLKDALVSTALPGDLTAYEQGGGRVDVTRAVTQPVTATGTVHLGAFEDGDAETVTHEVTYRNDGTEELELELGTDLATAGGEAPAEGAVTLSADSVLVPAGESVTVQIAVDPALLQRGQFTGMLHASGGVADDAVVLHTTLALSKLAPTHQVTFRGVDFEGQSLAVTSVSMRGADPRYDATTFVKIGETTTVEVGEGDYFLRAQLAPTVEGERATAVIVDPDLEVTGDMEIVLDARDTTRVRIETPEPAAMRGNVGFVAHREFEGRNISHSTMQIATHSIWVTPTEEAKDGVFEFTSRWQLGAPVLVGTMAGGDLEVRPAYERFSPVLESNRPLELVFAGEGKPEDYAGLDAAGKVAVVTPSRKAAQDVDAAVAAGAVALMIAPPEGEAWWTKYTGRGARLDLPVVVLSQVEGGQVRELLEGSRPVRMSFTGTPDVPYTYDVVQVSQGRVPEDVVHVVNEENSATITARYHEMGGDEWAKEQRFAWRPWQDTTIVEQQQELHTPTERVEVVSAGGSGTLWRQHVLHLFPWDSMSPLKDGAFHQIRTYEPGEQVSYDWYRSVARPAVSAGHAPARVGDLLSLRIPEMASGVGELSQRARPGEATMTLSENGETIAEGDQAWGDYPVGSAEAEYRLDLTVTREADAEWEYSTRTDTTWTFGSAPPAEDHPEVLPLLRVDYDVPVGTDNQARGDTTQTLGFTVAHPDGMDAPSRIDRAQAWASFDDGQRWRRVPLRAVAGGSPGEVSYTTRLAHPEAGGHVSLRFEAVDADGNTVEQEVIRAYGVTGR